MRFKSEYCGELLVQKGFWACYAFETARDMLLKRRPRIINILTNADLYQLSKLFSSLSFRRNHQEHAYLVHEGYSVRFFVNDELIRSTVQIPGFHSVKRETLKKNSQHALFTINSFFYDVEQQIYYDPLDRYNELKKGIIKTAYPPEHLARTVPTLALKTAKIFSETGFPIDAALKEELMKGETLDAYRQIEESVATEFNDICVSGRAYEAILLLKQLQVLDLLLPEVTALQDVYHDKDHHPEGDGFWHTLRCLKCVKTPNKNLIMAILLHDTGKLKTMEKKKNKPSFPNHSSMSGLIAKKVLKRFHYKREDIDEILFLVENHMKLNTLDKLPEGKRKTLLTSPYFPNLMELYRADLESGYHDVQNYYRAARIYREHLKREKQRRQGIYL